MSLLQAKKPSYIFLFICMSLWSVTAQSQEKYQIEFQGTEIAMVENINTFQWDQFPEESILNSRYTGWMQFYATPTLVVQKELEAAGIKMTGYVPRHTYVFTAPQGIPISFLKQKGVRAIKAYDNAMKLSNELKNNTIPQWAQQGNKVLVHLQYFNSIDRLSIIEQLKRDHINIIEAYTTGNIVVAAIKNERLQEIASRNYVKYMELIPAPDVKEDTDGRGLHRSSNLDTQRTGGRNYDGKGIGVLVRDDGIVGPHIDFQGRIDNSRASNSGPNHGDAVAGILAGAGNLNPENRGMAAGSNLFISNYGSSFLDNTTTGYIANGSVHITNSSYGNGCNAGYTTTARTVDSQTITTPHLLHVFSAGNSNFNDCGYGGGTRFGNITGGHKQGKNVMAVANVRENGVLATSSSNGPATDGRIKPDITAHGQGHVSTDENNTYRTFSGTSGAAPGIAGVAAQLYQAYQELGNGSLPESALIKAIMLNTANDAGDIGPDFEYGWGIVNGLRAVKSIENGTYINNSISQGGSQTSVIVVPANTAQLKVMLYWSDPAALPGVTTALVNDLDMTLTEPSGTVNDPFILNSAPNSFTLDQPATNGPDHLNNMEQVLINNPVAGNYTVDISGFNIPMGSQNYYIVYDIIQERLTLTYPDGGESFTPGSTEIIQWDAFNTTGNLNLQYSINNGTSWINIATVSGATTLHLWNIPNNVSGTCLVRITDATNNTSQSTNVFSIANRVNSVIVTQVCDTFINISWNAVAGASSYDIYLLGQETMELNGNSTTLSYDIPITDPNDTQWIAVVPKGGNGWKGLRSNAIEYDGGGLLNCTLSNDVAVSSILNVASDFQTICNPGAITIAAIIENLGTQDQSNFNISYQIGTEAIVQETFNGTLASGSNTTYSFTTPVNLSANGASSLKVWTSISGDEQIFNDEKQLDYVAVISGTPLDIEESFEINGVLPQGWILDNPDAGSTWSERIGVTGSDGNATTAAFMDGANYTSRGQLDSFTTSYYNIPNSGTATLTFDLAKAQWSAAFNDELRVEVSTDCGSTFTQVYFKDGLTLATVPYTNSTWTPSSAADWRMETIDLSSYLGNDILLKFININDHSNSTFIDNIALKSTLSTSEATLNDAIKLYPNPTSSSVYIEINQKLIEDVHIQIINNLGQVIQQSTHAATGNIISINLSNYSTGLYFLNLQSGTLQTTKKLIIE